MKYYFENNHSIIDNGILKHIDLAPMILIPEKAEVILGLKEEKDIGNKEYGNDIFYSSLNQNSVLKFVVLPEKGVKVIGEKAFEHCHQLTDINLPEGLEEIRLSAFLGCYRLRSIQLPKSIKKLDQWCFDLIDDLIINYKGSIEDWNRIDKKASWAKKGTLINAIDGELVV